MKSGNQSLSRRNFLHTAALSTAGSGLATAKLEASAAPGAEISPEPTLEDAFQWWSELPAKWTPVGWKDHMFRFNVLFDGTIIADPFTNQRTERWRDLGVQVSVAPSTDGDPVRSFFKLGDDNAVVQGWAAHPTPVLWSEWKWDALYLRKYIFAYVPGGEPVQTGIEPIYAWIRLEIHDLCEALPLEDRYGFVLKLNAPHISHTMSIRNNLIFHPHRSEYPPQYPTTGYPRRLYTDPGEYSAETGLLLRERSVWERPEETRIRLGFPAGQTCSIRFLPDQPTDQDSSFFVEMDVQKGNFVDLLLPMLPTEEGVFLEEAGKGYEDALSESDRFWARKPDTAAVFQTHESHIDGTAEHGLKFAEIIAEKNPESGHYSLLTGSWVYCNLWATPLAFTSIWFLDTLGYHSVVEKYLKVFKAEQGKVVPPGDAFHRHPGYLSTPPSLTSIDWLSDHGALLYAVSSHALLSGNRAFIQEWTEPIAKACDFIKDARRIDNHDGVKGVLPPAIATDRRTKIQAVWNDGWNYKGLVTAVRLLEKIGHPRAEEFSAEARDYRQLFQKALRDKTRNMPRWTDGDGVVHRLVPTSLTGETREELRHAFYLDTGPLFLVFSGLMSSEDELMRSALKWFREGPQTRMYQYDSNCWQVPSLFHEVSSCEPNMSWSFFHSHQDGDRLKYLEGMYSLFANRISRQTFTNCETRGGVYGLTPSLTEIYLARLAVVDDQLSPDALHLFRLVPRAWLTASEPSRFLRMPTEFGPVSLTGHTSDDGSRLDVTFEPQFRDRPRQVILHIPPFEGLREVRLNGTTLNWNHTTRTAEIG